LLTSVENFKSIRTAYGDIIGNTTYADVLHNNDVPEQRTYYVWRCFMQYYVRCLTQYYVRRCPTQWWRTRASLMTVVRPLYVHVSDSIWYWSMYMYVCIFTKITRLRQLWIRFASFPPERKPEHPLSHLILIPTISIQLRGSRVPFIRMYVTEYVS
jgi:hypothetical protein